MLYLLIVKNIYLSGCMSGVIILSSVSDSCGGVLVYCGGLGPNVVTAYQVWWAFGSGANEVTAIVYQLW